MLAASQSSCHGGRIAGGAMKIELAQFEGIEADRLKRLGAAVLAIWNDLPEDIQAQILAKCGELKGSPCGTITEMDSFLSRYAGQIT